MARRVEPVETFVECFVTFVLGFSFSPHPTSRIFGNLPEALLIDHSLFNYSLLNYSLFNYSPILPQSNILSKFGGRSSGR